jgi:hypothetical protein
MASTFSNLGLILMTTGEDSGTWGFKTNVNLQRIDFAMDGIAELTITGSTTLAFSTNLDTTTYSQEAGRAGILVLSGTPGAVPTITVPNIEKQYLINNTMSTSATFSAGTGASTVSVGAGSKTIIYVDGSDEVIEGISATNPGGTDKQIQFNDNGAFGGITMGTTGQVLTTDGTTASFGDISGGASWQAVITADPANAVAGNGYFCNTTGGAFTVTLPTAATIGDFISFIDYAGTFDTNNLTIGRNGHNIQGTAADLTVATERAGFTLVYVDATQGWLLQNN